MPRITRGWGGWLRQPQCDAFARLDAIMEIGTAVLIERTAASRHCDGRRTRVSRVAIAHRRPKAVADASRPLCRGVTGVNAGTRY
jgi:hypothetical protein